MSYPVTPAELLSFHRRIQRLYVTGDDSGLEVLGYGEVSSVLALRTSESAYACKCLPMFANPDSFERYRACFDRYFQELQDRGMLPLESWIQTVSETSGRVAAYCFQPRIDAGSLLTRVLRECETSQALDIVGEIRDRVIGFVSPANGFDGQFSNWVLHRGELRYLDVTTPLLRDESGGELLDTDLFLAAAPLGTRRILKRFILRGILDGYHSVRGVFLDLLGNLYKERLGRWIPHFLPVFNERIACPLTAEEVRRHYRKDARIWTLWQTLRRTDRFVKLNLLGKPYPFLLPPRIER